MTDNLEKINKVIKRYEKIHEDTSNCYPFLPDTPDESGLWLVHDLETKYLPETLRPWKEQVISTAINNKNKENNKEEEEKNSSATINKWNKYSLLARNNEDNYGALWNTAEGRRQYCQVQVYIKNKESKSKESDRKKSEKKKVDNIEWKKDYFNTLGISKHFLPHIKVVMERIEYDKIENMIENRGYDEYIIKISINIYIHCLFFQGFCKEHNKIVDNLKNNPSNFNDEGLIKHGNPYFFWLTDSVESYDTLSSKELLTYQYQQLNQQGHQAPFFCDDNNVDTAVVAGVRGVVMVNKLVPDANDSTSLKKLIKRPAWWLWLLAIHQRAIAEHLASEAVKTEDTEDKTNDLEALKELQKDILSYENTWMYHQVASSVSGDKLFKCFSKILDIKDMWADVREQHEARATYIQNEHDKRLADTINLLMIMAIPITILGALLTLNINSTDSATKHHFYGFVTTAIIGVFVYGAVKLFDRITNPKERLLAGSGWMSISSMGVTALFWWGNKWIMEHKLISLTALVMAVIAILCLLQNTKRQHDSSQNSERSDEESYSKKFKQQAVISIIVIIGLVLMVVFLEIFSL
jgi:uncharacterized membrane protein